MVSGFRYSLIDEKYYNWLVSIIINDSPPVRTYNKLLRQLYETVYYWRDDIPMDENRAIDGVDLRYLYYEERFMNRPVGPEDDIPCSVLEMLVALARRCNDWVVCDPDERYGYWFWTFIGNLGLLDMSDDKFDTYFVQFVIDRWLFGRYEFDGSGGLFPLKDATKDQRKVDLWSQMGYFLDETYF